MDLIDFDKLSLSFIDNKIYHILSYLIFEAFYGPTLISINFNFIIQFHIDVLL